MAATQDRKVYCPSRNPPYGLLEIKCQSCETLIDVKCLKQIDDVLHIKKNDNYFYQVQMQMAVTGVEWFDFFI